MNDIKLKFFLILIMLLYLPFSCKDTIDCMDLDVSPYYSMQNIEFQHVDKYWINHKTNTISLEKDSLDYENTIYAADSMALFFKAPDDELLYHSKNKIKKKFSLIQEAFACVSKRNGWAGTRDLVDKIYISSNYDYNEAHGKDYDLSDIVDIFAYTTTGKDKWMPLGEYNKNSPYEAPKRFYLIIKTKPTKSPIQQFVIKYYMLNEPGVPSKYFIITTPVFHVR